MSCQRLEQDGLLAELGDKLDAHVEECADCRERLRGYRRLAELVGQGASARRAPEGFAARTLARVRAAERKRRRWREARWGAGAVAAVAALVLWLVVGREPPAPQLARLVVEVGARGSWRADAGELAARPGDEVRVRAQAGGARYFELRVYRGAELVARCPAPGPACVDGGAQLVWTAPAVGTYQLLLWVSAKPIAPSRGELEGDQRAALEGGARLAEIVPLRVY